MPSVKYEDHPFLPASVPKDQAHILQNTIEKEVDEDGVAASDGHLLCDFIATFLYNLENYPDAPKDFFDPDVKSFTINRKVVEGKTSHLQTFLILRKKNRVVCGFYEYRDDLERMIDWESVTKSRLSEVAPDATWKTTWGARQPYTLPPVDSFWNATFARVNEPLYVDCNPRTKKEAIAVAYDFGEALYNNSAWEKDESSTFMVTQYTGKARSTGRQQRNRTDPFAGMRPAHRGPLFK